MYLNTTLTYPRTLAEAQQRRHLWRMTWTRSQQRPMAWYLDDGPPPPRWVVPLAWAAVIVAVLAAAFAQPGWAIRGLL